mmetsp:Transcript_57752/g.161051  ORF Transcript_57752/g.161051 Transcript_57752/m.161051 type:complete len:253 (+) Transcript_57752:1058-1816(+)
MRSTMASAMSGSTFNFSQSSCSATLSIHSSSAFLALWAIWARALSTPPSSCQCLSKCSTLACLDMTPLRPIAAQSLVSSDMVWASNSSFFCTTTARSFASCSRLSARSFASWATMFSSALALLLASTPWLAASSLSSLAGMAFNSFFLLAVSSSSNFCTFCSSLSSSPSSSASSSSWVSIGDASSWSSSPPWAGSTAAGFFITAAPAVFASSMPSTSALSWPRADLNNFVALPVTALRFATMIPTAEETSKH